MLTTKLNWLATQAGIEDIVVSLEENGEPFFKIAKEVKRIALNVAKLLISRIHEIK